MKPVNFAYARPARIDEAVALLHDNASAKILAGGQTLGPLLNLRLVQPDLLIDVTRIPELTRVEETRDEIVYGACITHAAFEDRRLPDAANGLLAHVAAGIGYRAVRSRGTVGGSLAYSDPAADWVSAFAALDARVLVTGAAGRRRIGAAEFVRGPMAPDLDAGEMIDGIAVPLLSSGARWGFAKICRKAGEYAEAIGVVVYDPVRDYPRFVAGATGGRPIVLGASDVAQSTGDRLPTVDEFDSSRTKDSLRRAGLADDLYELNIHAVALRRALKQAAA